MKHAIEYKCRECDQTNPRAAHARVFCSDDCQGAYEIRVTLGGKWWDAEVISLEGHTMKARVFAAHVRPASTLAIAEARALDGWPSGGLLCNYVRAES